jgi:4-hydroxy-4-methyl-2-oxoglutarate aldolase
MTNIIIKKDFRRLDRSSFGKLADIPTSVLSDSSTERRTLDYNIRSMNRGRRVAGPALTVKLGHDSNLLLHAALILAKPGDILVVDNAGDTAGSVFGEIMSTVALRIGVAGLVVDGLVRDSDKYSDIGFPIFARGSLPRVVDRGPSPGSINLPIRCGGVAIEPGDLVVADDDGVMAIAPGQVSVVLEKAKKKLSDEEQRLKAIAAGALAPAWLESALASAGVHYLD